MINLKTIAQHIGAQLVGPADCATWDIARISPIQSAVAGHITFVANPDYYQYLPQTKASAVIVKDQQSSLPHLAQLVHPNPYMAFAKAAQLFYQPQHPWRGVSEQSQVAASAKLGKDVGIGPFCVVGERVQLGERVVLYPGVVVGNDVTIGDDTVLYPHCVVGERCHVGKRNIIHAGTVIGADGFGFAMDEHEIVKIPQIGTVRIEDDVELGACVTIDRAAMGETVIQRGCKFDDKVHIGHNAIIGENCVFSAQTAVAGSAKVGRWVKSGGLAGIAGHLTVGDHVSIGAMTGVIKDAEADETYMGFPAIKAGEWRRRQVYLKKLADYETRLKDLETRLQAQESRN